MRFLTLDQKRVMIDVSLANLECFKANPKELLDLYVTFDVTWVHHCTPETKMQINTPAHRSALAMTKIHDLHQEIFEYPPYSPELVPNLFSNINKWL
ncbi:hypothetical protein LAZ67_19001432 [Cordylochernes scorpioides]|uniref:Transposase n=1 Tax=Cordylochernes scorpioides TaxID=51811 RepID=A0ABY6LHN7_9ARAC|nr:hypothetical protein LAZ67_19001432 [Cordylochernes scorpioides]